MESGKDKEFYDILEEMGKLPIGIQRALWWVIRHLDFIEAVCKETNMTVEEFERYEVIAREKNDYLFLVLIQVVQQIYKNVTGKLKWTNNGKEKSPTKYSLLSIMLVNIILERRKGNGEGKNVQRNTSLQANRIYNQEVCSSNRNRQKDSPKVLEYERRRIFKISGREP